MDEREDPPSREHDIEPIVKETKALVEDRTSKFQTYLATILPHHPKRKALQAALTQNARYVESQVLMFLRCECFQVAIAVEKMISFYEMKAHLFGWEKLGRDVTLEDLDNDDRAVLKSGFLQQLPVRDRSGSTIWIFFTNIHEYKVPENLGRVAYYVAMASLEDDETQRKGAVGIISTVANPGQQRLDFPEALLQNSWIVQCLPFKQINTHHCSVDETSRIIIKTALHFFRPSYRTRYKIHDGDHLECSDALAIFGISPKGLPLTMDGELKLKNHLDWIKMRAHQEAMTGDKQNRILVPTHKDVLFGRGTPFRDHVGNMHLHQMLDENLARYDALNQTKKKSNAIAEMVKTIKKEGGRFLKREAGCVWVEVSDKHAHEKVSHAIRTRLRVAAAAGSSIRANREHGDADVATSLLRNNVTTATPVVREQLADTISLQDLNEAKRRKVNLAKEV